MTMREKFQKLVELLYKNTIERKIAWSYDSTLGVWASIGGNIINFRQGQNENLEPMETIAIKTSQWKPVESFDDEFFGQETPQVGGFSTYWQLMSGIREMAQRQAIGADEAIDDVLSALDDGTS